MNLLVDKPDVSFASDNAWKEFLSEMKSARARTIEHSGFKSAGTLKQINQLIVEAIKVLNDRKTEETKSVSRFNPNHEPGGGPDGGQFAPGDGGGGGGSELSKPSAPAGEIQNNKIPHSMSPDEKVARLVALTETNKPILDAAIAKIDAKHGTKSSSDIKKTEKIKSKATRPSILAAKPWFDVEYIRDSLRFKTVVDTFADTKAIVGELENSGDFKVIKYDVTKVTNPKEWGWRMLPIDLQMKNGQIVEYYMVSKDQAKVASEGHAIFEKWRNLDAAKFTPQQVSEYHKDLAASQKLNGDAWTAYKDRTGQTESDFLASVTRALTSSKSRIR